MSQPAGPGLSIREAALATGLSAHTLRYYERIGLLLPVGRARSGHRRYGPEELRWLQFLKCLQATDMPIRTMREYARLARKGAAGAAERRALLAAHRDAVGARLEQLRSTLSVIDRKLASYDRPEDLRRGAR